MAKAKKLKFTFDFHIINNGKIIKTSTIVGIGDTEGQAMENAVEKLERLEYRYTGKFQYVGEASVNDLKPKQAAGDAPPEEIKSEGE